MESNKKKELLLSPRSTRTINNTKSIGKTINSEFKEKYLKKEEEVYDFNTNSYIKSQSRIQDLKGGSRIQDLKSGSRVQDLINKYNVRKESSLMNPINVMYVPRSIPSKNTFRRSDNERIGNPFTRDCASVKSENTIRRSENAFKSVKSENAFKSVKSENAFNSVKSENAFNSESVRNSYLPRQERTASPFSMGQNRMAVQDRIMGQDRMTAKNEMAVQDRPHSSFSIDRANSVSPFYNTRNIPSPFTRKDDIVRGYSDLQSRRTASPNNNIDLQSRRNLTNNNDFVLYGPSVLLTLPLSFTILNTVFSFDKEVETSIYYIEVTSNITWTIKKNLKELISLLKEPVLKTKGLDKQVRDNMISTLLNKVEMNKDLQYFIMTDITREKTYKGEYLLLNNIPYIFKLVGKALVSYNILNRVHKIFILEECDVGEGRNEYSFFIRNREGQVELYASCRIERDEWIKDIVNFINKQ